MAESNSNGFVIKVIYWTLILGAYAFTLYAAMMLTDNIICNDRLRAEEDRRIEMLATSFRNERQQQFEEILQRLARIEVKIEKIK